MHEFHVLTSSDIHIELANKWPSIGGTREKFATFFFALSNPDFERKKKKRNKKQKQKRNKEKKQKCFSPQELIKSNNKYLPTRSFT